MERRETDYFETGQHLFIISNFKYFKGAAIRVRKPCGTEINCVNFCANNYLGLSAHPEVVDGARAALESHGAGLSSVRFICGTQDIHLELEKRLAKLHGTDDAILYAACFDANAGIFEVKKLLRKSLLMSYLGYSWKR